MRLHLHPTRPEAVTVEERTLRKWSLDSHARAELTVPLKQGEDLLFGGIWDSAVTPEGDRLALATSHCGSGAIELRDWRTLEVAETLSVPEVAGFTALAFSPDGHWLAVADDRERILLIDRTTGQVSGTHEVGACYTVALAFHPGSRLLAAVSTDQGGGSISLLEAAAGSLREISRDLNDRGRTWDFADTFATLAFSPAGEFLAVHACSGWGADTPGWQSEVLLFDWRRGALAWSTPVDAALLGLEGAPECQHFNSGMVFVRHDACLLTGSPFGSVLALDTRTGRLLQRTPAGTDGPLRGLHLDCSQSRVWALAGNEARIISIPLESLLPPPDRRG